MATAKTPKTPKKVAPKKEPKAQKETTAKKAAKSTSSFEDIVKVQAEELLSKVGFTATVAVTPREEGGCLVQIDSSEDTNLLIGFHGQTLAALQLILGLAVQKETGEWAPIILNVGDYRERREEQLRHLAQSVAQRVRFSGQPQIITRLNAAERRIVHLTLAEDEMVETISEGEGVDRHLVVRPKQVA